MIRKLRDGVVRRITLSIVRETAIQSQKVVAIIESVDPICRDGADTPISSIQK